MSEPQIKILAEDRDPMDTRASMVHMDAGAISERYESRNKKVRLHKSAAHVNELCSVLERISKGETPFLLSAFAAKAIACGMPADPMCLHADEKILAVEARYMILAFPRLKHLQRDARLWLEFKLKRPAEKFEPSIAWNMALGGEAIK